MIKHLFSIVLVLFLYGQAFSFPPFVMSSGSSTGEATCSTTNVTFWWRAEDRYINGDCVGSGDPNACCTGEDTGTCGYTAGSDVSGTLTNEAAINSAAGMVGTNGLDVPTTYDYIVFSANGNDVSAAEGRLGFWYRYTTWVEGGGLVRFVDSSPVFEVELNLTSSDELTFAWYDDSTQRTALTTATSPIASAATEYFIEIAWKVSTNYREIFVNGVSQGSSSETIGSSGVVPNALQFGDTNGSTNIDEHIDHVIISSDSTDNLYPCRTQEFYAD